MPSCRRSPTEPEFGLASPDPAAVRPRPGVRADPAELDADGRRRAGDPPPLTRSGEVLYAGRIAAAKSVEDLIRAAALSASRGRCGSSAWARRRGGSSASSAVWASPIGSPSRSSWRPRPARPPLAAAAPVLPGGWETFGLAAGPSGPSGGRLARRRTRRFAGRHPQPRGRGPRPGCTGVPDPGEPGSARRTCSTRSNVAAAPFPTSSAHGCCRHRARGPSPSEPSSRTCASSSTARLRRSPSQSRRAAPTVHRPSSRRRGLDARRS